MILVQWSCEPPLEKIDRFAKFAKEKLKPFYKSHGCKRFELFTPMQLQKKYFSYQVKEKMNRYTEQLIFNDLEDFESFLEAVDKDPHSEKILESYEREFGVSSCKFIILKQKV